MRFTFIFSIETTHTTPRKNVVAFIFGAVKKIWRIDRWYEAGQQFADAISFAPIDFSPI